LILRWIGKDLLALAPNSHISSYWILREPSENQSSMIDQF
jgi:hypothetical protein